VALGSDALNLNSPKQLANLFFNVMKIPVKDKWRTKTGISTASSVIQEIAKENPQVSDLLEYRELVKIKGTYIDSIVKKIVNGKIHTTFNQTGTLTGRMSCMSPNLQNQPSGEKYNIREAFKSKQGYSFIDADFSQIELRILASMS
jgi:DNA polymerase I